MLGFLATIKERRQAASKGATVPVGNPALAVKAGLFVFTGTVDGAGTDWVELEREERDKELMETVTARNTRA